MKTCNIHGRGPMASGVSRPACQGSFLFPEIVERKNVGSVSRRRPTGSPLGNSYFSGAGLFDLGLQRGGLQIQQSFELDPVCCATLRRNFRHEVVQSDLTKELAKRSRACDFMAFTYPCTKYSGIADIHGTRTGDELYLHALRQTVLHRPEVYVHENVPGMRKFAVVMEAITELPDYYVTVFCPVKACTGLPQRRDRLIVLGSRRSFNWRPPVQSRPVALAEILEDVLRWRSRTMFTSVCGAATVTARSSVIRRREIWLPLAWHITRRM